MFVEIQSSEHRTYVLDVWILGCISHLKVLVINSMSKATAANLVEYKHHAHLMCGELFACRDVEISRFVCVCLMGVEWNHFEQSGAQCLKNTKLDPTWKLLGSAHLIVNGICCSTKSIGDSRFEFDTSAPLPTSTLR